MKSILLVALSNIKKRKLQSILVGIIILIASMALATSVGVLTGLDGPYEKVAEKLNSSHLYLLFDTRIHSPDELAGWWEAQAEVESVSPSMQYKILDEMVIHNGNRLLKTIILYEHPIKINQDKLVILEGDKKEFPDPGEVWIPASLAYGDDIKIGDKLSIPVPSGEKDMKVSAIVVDLPNSSSMSSNMRIWVSPGTLTFYFPASSLTEVETDIRLYSPDKMEELWEKYENYLGMPFCGAKMDYRQYAYYTNFILKIAAVLVLIFSVFIVLIAIYILSSTISSSIIADYKNIGILKTSGYTPFDIIKIYLLQFLLISAAAAPLGALAGIPVMRLMLAGLFKTLGIFNLEPSFIIPVIITAIVVIALITVSAYIASRNAGKVKPADAIRYGAPIKVFNKACFIKVQDIKTLPITLTLGIKNVFAAKRQSVYTIVIIAVSAFAVTFSINTFYSILKMADNISYWGMEKSDVTITQKGKRFGVEAEELYARLKADRNVKAVITGDYMMNNSTPKTGDISSEQMVGFNYDGDMNLLSLRNLEGKNPEKENEISLAVNTGKKYNKRPGDSFVLYIDGKKLEFTVCGIYQTINNSGTGYRIQTSAVRLANPTYEPRSFYILLKDDVSIDDYISTVKRLYGEAIDARPSSETYLTPIRSISSGIGIFMVFIALLFISILIVSVINSTLLDIYKQRKDFGVYKTFGMTPSQIMGSVALKYVALTAATSLIAMPASLWAAPVLLSLIMMNMGILTFPFSINIIGTVLVVPAVVLISFLSSWLPSARLLEISSRNLIVE
jgi:putative ABC transport system permease protein